MNIDIYVFVIVIHATVGMIGEAPVEPEHGCPVGVSSSLYYISLSLGFGNIAQQAAFNCGPSSHPDFIKNYFLLKRMFRFFRHS